MLAIGSPLTNYPLASVSPPPPDSSFSSLTLVASLIRRTVRPSGPSCRESSKARYGERPGRMLRCLLPSEMGRKVPQCSLVPLPPVVFPGYPPPATAPPTVPYFPPHSPRNIILAEGTLFTGLKVASIHSKGNSQADP